ncbi:MAG: hypothetical protein LBG52_08570 [Candidatus Peribacteria bacterium]|jgi:hypothetical protein|nr:hypothetical protein [Candidatus Peribacteria bacterium]
MKSIDNQLNFPDTSQTSYDTKNLEATKAHLFDERRGNADFQKQVQHNLKSSTHTEAFAKTEQLQDIPKGFSTLYNLYKENKAAVFHMSKTKGVAEEEIQQLFLLVETELRDNKHDTDNQNALHAILSSIDKAYIQATKQEIEETLLLAMIGGPMQYLGTSDASHNLKNDIHIDDKKLTTTIGTGERTQISIDYGQKKPHIFVSDFLYKQEGNYQLGLHHLKPTSISIASEEHLFAQAVETVQAKAEPFKKQAKSLHEYQAMMSQAIYESQMQLFEGKLGEKSLATEMIKQHIDKNTIAQKIFGVFTTILNFDGKNEVFPNFFAETSTPEPLMKFVVGLDKFLEYSTPTECQTRKQNMEKLSSMIQSAQHPQTTNFTYNKSELFNDTNLSPQLIKNTQQLLRGQSIAPEQNPDLNLFTILFSHCLPKEGEEGTNNATPTQCFSDFITYNETGKKSLASLAPILTSRDNATASLPPQ